MPFYIYIYIYICIYIYIYIYISRLGDRHRNNLATTDPYLCKPNLCFNIPFNPHAAGGSFCPLQNYAKKLKMTETLANESTQ